MASDDLVTGRPREVEAQAADWLARLDGERWDDDQQRALDVWLAASTLNRVSFLRLQAGWQRADGMARLPLRPAPAERTTWPWFNAWPMAAAIAALSITALLAGSLAHTDMAQFTQGETYRTGVGAQSQLALTDGSVVTLNTDTRLLASVDSAHRRVLLERGEAFFDVAKDASKPFIIVAGTQRIEVLGTRFSVRRDEDTVAVMVVEGRVRVYDSKHADGQVLSAGDAARSNLAGVKVDRRTVDQIEQALGWRQGFLVFKDVELAEAAAEFNRYNERKLIIAHPEAAHMRIGGRFATHNIDGFARLLNQGLGLQVSEESDRIVISQ